MKGKENKVLDPRRIEVMDDVMAEILRRKTPTERLAIGSKDLTRTIGDVTSGMVGQAA